MKVRSNASENGRQADRQQPLNVRAERVVYDPGRSSFRGYAEWLLAGGLPPAFSCIRPNFHLRMTPGSVPHSRTSLPVARGVHRMSVVSRRRFLKSAAGGAAGAAALGTVAATLADDGTTYALQGIDVSHWQGTINW